MGEPDMQALVLHPRITNWAVCKAFGWVWPDVYVSRASALRLLEVPTPALPTAEWVRVRTVLGGICGSDVRLVLLRQHPGSMLRSFVQFPVILGHENVGVIEEVGSGAGQAGWQKGERVCVEPALSCQARGIEPPCPPCAAGRFSLCQRFMDPPLPPGMMIGLNGFTGGSWGEYFVAHHSQLHRVPEGLGDEVAVLTDPLACAVHAVLRHRPGSGQTVLVLGGGMLGVAVVAAIRALGSDATITIVVRHDHQAGLARRFGADGIVCWGRRDRAAERYRALAERVDARCLPGRYGNQAVLGGFDVVYDCVGTGRSLTDALKWAAPRGVVLQVGTPDICLVETVPVWLRELTVMGCYGRQIESYGGREMHTYEVVFDLIGAGRLDPAGLLTHTFALREYGRAFGALANRAEMGLIKAAFRFGPG
jgi:L-iditol 2-dehydrogenase